VVTELLCPVCKSRLEPLETPNITIDRCPYCKGIWFDPGELETYCAGQGNPGSKNPFAGAGFEKGAGSNRRQCPRCQTDTLSFGTLAGYDVWRCNDCKGYFVFSETIDEFIPLTSGQKAMAGLAGLLELLTAGL